MTIDAPSPPSGRHSALLAVSTGLIAANICCAQPLAGPIGEALGTARQATGLIVTPTQVGYGLGLLLIVPLGDLIENRKLTLALTAVAAAGLLGAAAAPYALLFLVAALLIGIGPTFRVSLRRRLGLSGRRPNRRASTPALPRQGLATRGRCEA